MFAQLKQDGTLGPRSVGRKSGGRDGSPTDQALTGQVVVGYSARAFVKVLRVARTIADLENEDRVRTPHVAEAIQGRLLDREVAR